MRFRKYHGAGNDFVMLVDLDASMGPAASLDQRLVAALCDRHTGVGADGLIRVMVDDQTRAAGGAVRMDYYNADGGPAEMCGNGIRCTVVLAHRIGAIEPGEHVVMTGAGPRTIRLAGDAVSVSVDMGEPALERELVPMLGSGSSLRADVDGVEGTGVSMGNPHFVVFGRDLADVSTLGPTFERHPAFPQGTNVEFVDVLSETEVRIRVWERGVGETLACGSGACAVGVAAAALGRTKRELDVHSPGGTLHVTWAEDGHVWLTGPAEEVYKGELDPAWLAHHSDV